MNEEPHPESTEPTPQRFQFGMKYVLAAPVVLALFLSTATVFDFWWAVPAWLFGLTIIGLFFRQSRRFAAVAMALWVVWLLLLLPANSSYEAVRKSICSNNLKQIALALHGYHDAYGSFPPAYIADEDGRPMHSWRALILPYIEQNALYDRYDFTEPWDGPNNRKLADICLSVFNCPADHGEPSTMTNYLAIIGPDTAWPGAQTTCLKDFADGTPNTLFVVEVADSGIHWMEPRDLHMVQMAPTINSTAGQGISSHHPGGANALSADGSVLFLPDNVLAEDLRAMLTRSGGERIDVEEATSRRAD